MDVWEFFLKIIFQNNVPFIFYYIGALKLCLFNLRYKTNSKMSFSDIGFLLKYFLKIKYGPTVIMLTTIQIMVSI